MSTFLNDIKYGIRMLAKQPAMTITIICVLALGIGANTALFSVIQSVLLSPLPFSDPERLVFVRMQSGTSGGNPACSAPDYLDWARQNTVFESMCAFHTPQFTLTNAGDPVTVTGFKVSRNFIKTLGAELCLGRGFSSDENQTDDQQVVILGHQLWHDRFGADPNILGRTITLDGLPWCVVGIAQPTMGFVEDYAQLFVPSAVSSQ